MRAIIGREGKHAPGRKGVLVYKLHQDEHVAGSTSNWPVPGRRYDLSDFVSLKAQMNLASEPGMSHGMLDVDLKARRLSGLFAQAEGITCSYEEGGLGLGGAMSGVSWWEQSCTLP